MSVLYTYLYTQFYVYLLCVDSKGNRQTLGDMIIVSLRLSAYMSVRPCVVHFCQENNSKCMLRYQLETSYMDRSLVQKDGNCVPHNF